MDYSDRVNAKKGGGGVADTQETNVHTKRRLKELLTSEVLDLENDPYVFRNHLGLLECRLCLTTHTNESSYISHLGGRKHTLNLERRRILDEKYNRKNNANGQRADGGGVNGITINNIVKRTWNKIGRPSYKITKVRDPTSLQMGVLINVKYPSITTKEPLFLIMSYYELSASNQTQSAEYFQSFKNEEDEDGGLDPKQWQYVVFSAQPYENIAIAIPVDKEIDRPAESDEMTKSYWWFWDEDTKEFFLQLLFK
ncbi:hypothetical protein HYPBUDRAFT_105273 [Hyphopichia burtonii NRRL Y-1933]|uniref:U1-type domain-containing protein n=1 Tax=Hyphopichia burtonii NRRL Y-1933 TaxID=984485 RepID=A0A1E4RPA7_9ASCO|nr:hypothetical protein HYPBUDRAFT_105273 [Hyphopichia burtonii NRRL Y-1933]ODV69078.1 hypothetical protein HYPBUDRAFT_105273 [Hyphopichia burtonii NRRL Y-1933]